MEKIWDWWQTAQAAADQDSWVFGLCLLVVLLAPLIAHRLRIPGIVGVLVAGIVLGPNALDLLDRDTFITRLGTIGKLFIFGLAGLELDLHEFRRRRGASFSFGMITFLFPQSLGLAIGLVMGLGWMGGLLLGSVFASHTLLTYPIVKRLGIQGRDPVMVAVGSTMIADTAALLVLAVVARAEASGSIDWTIFAGLLVGLSAFSLICFLLIPRCAAWAFRILGGNPPAEFLMILAMIFLGAWFSSLLGVASMVGAFMVGLALNRLVPDQSTLMNRLQFVGDTLFIPFFLFSVGMLLDIRLLLSDVESWYIGAVMLVAVCVGKLGAAIAGGRLLGFDRQGITVMFGLTLSQAAATLAVVVVGLELEIFSEAIFNGTLIMIFGSCVIAAFFTERSARSIAQQTPRYLHVGDPPQRLLIPLSNPATVDAVLSLSLLIRDRGSHEPLHPLVVVPDDEGVEELVSEGERLLSHAVMHAVAAEVAVTPLIRVDTNVASAVVRAAKELRISTIMVGWNGHVSARERIFSGILDQMLAEAPPRIMVSRLRQPLPSCQRILLAIPPFAEIEPGFRRTLTLIRNMAQQLHRKIIIWCVGQDLGAETRSRLSPKEQLTVEIEEAGSWTQIRNRMLEQSKEGDLLILLSAREGSVSWRPGFERLPRLLTTRCPKANILLIYPPLPGFEVYQHASATMHSSAAIQGEILFPRIAPCRLEHDQWQDAVAVLSDSLPLDPLHRRNIAAGLISEVKREALQLAPGVLLLHAHSPSIQQSTLMIGMHEEGLLFPRVETAVHSILFLLSRSLHPEDQQQHLRRLAALARLVRDPQRMQSLQAAQDDERLRQVIEGRLEQDDPEVKDA